MSTNQNNRACAAVSGEAKAVPQVSDGTARASHFILKGEHMRLFIMAMLVIPSTALAGWSLYEIFLPNGLTNLEIAQLGLGLTLFAWLCMAFWTGIIGFFLQLFNIDPLSLRRNQSQPDATAPLTQKHAVVMPVYNEDTRRIMVGFEACIRELMESENSIRLFHA